MNIQSFAPAKNRVDNSIAEFKHQRVVAIVEDRVLLDNGESAKISVSALVQVEVGDLVLVSRSGDYRFIISILDRNNRHCLQLHSAGATKMTVQVPELIFVAEKSISQYAGEKIQLACPKGSILTQAKNVMATVTNNLVHTAARFFSRSDQTQIEASELMTIRTEHGLIEARKDLRMNAEHINMG